MYYKTLFFHLTTILFDVILYHVIRDTTLNCTVSQQKLLKYNTLNTYCNNSHELLHYYLWYFRYIPRSHERYTLRYRYMYKKHTGDRSFADKGWYLLLLHYKRVQFSQLALYRGLLFYSLLFLLSKRWIAKFLFLWYLRACWFLYVYTLLIIVWERYVLYVSH